MPILEACPYRLGDWINVKDVLDDSLKMAIIVNRDVNPVEQKVILKLDFVHYRSVNDEWIYDDFSCIAGKLYSNPVQPMDVKIIDYFTFTPSERKRLQMCTAKRQQNVHNLETILGLTLPLVLFPIILGYWQC